MRVLIAVQIIKVAVLYLADFLVQLHFLILWHNTNERCTTTKSFGANK